MLAGIAALAPSHLPPPSHAPPPAAPHRPCACPPPPPYALVIAPAGKDVGGPQVIFPLHAVVLATHCVALPCLARPASSHSPSSVSLPVLPLRTRSPSCTASCTPTTSPPPSPPSPLLPAFLSSLERPSTSDSHSHSNSQDAAHAAILVALVSGTARHTRAAHLHAASAGNPTALTGHAAHVKDEAPLWDALDLAWVVFGALRCISFLPFKLSPGSFLSCSMRLPLPPS
ncbi:hypothetical protein C8R44DRAFT_895788 [Mycena epipterygia]|nr:hypothetical protein C8R44DRAFT_895788 [Mycena epipterygia]